MKKLFIYSTNTNGFNTVGRLQINNLFPDSAIVYREINDNNSFLLLRDNISSLSTEAKNIIYNVLINHMLNFDKIYIVIHSTGIQKKDFLEIPGFNPLNNKCLFFPNASHVQNNPYYMTAVKLYNNAPTALQDALKVFEGDHELAEKLILLHQCLNPSKLNEINAPDSLIEDFEGFKKKITEKRLSAVDEAYVKELLSLREKWLANA